MFALGSGGFEQGDDSIMSDDWIDSIEHRIAKLESDSSLTRQKINSVCESMSDAKLDMKDLKLDIKILLADKSKKDGAVAAGNVLVKAFWATAAFLAGWFISGDPPGGPMK